MGRNRAGSRRWRHDQCRYVHRIQRWFHENHRLLVFRQNKKDFPILSPFLSGYSQPTEDVSADGSDSLIASGGSFQGGVYEYWFRRKLDTGDDKDKVIEDKTIDLVYAWGTSSTLAYHGPSQRALASINFASTEGVATVLDLSRTMIQSHGYIMIIAWSVMGIAGSCIARFGRGWQYWLKAHRLLQVRHRYWIVLSFA